MAGKPPEAPPGPDEAANKPASEEAPPGPDEAVKPTSEEPEEHGGSPP